MIPELQGRIRARWEAMDRTARGAALVSLGSFTLVVMAMLVKQVGTRIPTIEILFSRSIVGFFFVLPMFIHNPLEPLRTKRLGLHAVRGIIGTLGNICFFWTITHMLLADAMALQFSRPLFMIPLALAFLGEVAGFRRTAITLVGFAGIALYAKPFTEGFDPGAFVGAAGARCCGGGTSAGFLRVSTCSAVLSRWCCGLSSATCQVRRWRCSCSD